MVPAIDSRYSRFLPLKRKDFALSLECFELNSGSTRDQRSQKISHGILNQSSFDPSISAIQIGGDKMVSERFRAIKKKTMEKDGPEPGRFSLGQKRTRTARSLTHSCDAEGISKNHRLSVKILRDTPWEGSDFLENSI